jgi:hypothetical protein
MSTAYFIVLDNSDHGFDTTVNGKFLSKNAKQLEKIAKSLGIRMLDDFISYSPDEARAMMEDLGSDPAEIAKMELPEQKWFDPQEGLELVGKLAAHVQENPSAVKNAKGVLADLGEYQEVFEKANAIGARWNLRMDF